MFRREASVAFFVLGVSLAAGLGSGCEKKPPEAPPQGTPAPAGTAPAWASLSKEELLKAAIKSHDEDRIDEGVAQLQLYLERAPEDPEGNAYYGSILTKKAKNADGNVEKVKWVKKGFQALDESVLRFPDAYVVYLVRGINGVSVPAMFERFRMANLDFEKLLEMRKADPKKVPDSVMPLILFHQAQALDLDGKGDAAKLVRQRLVAEYPASAEAKKVP